MPVEIANKTRSRINLKKAEQTLLSLLKHYKLTDRLVSLTFVGDVRMQSLNKQWRHLDRPTDILSFPHLDKAGWPRQGGTGAVDLLGELIIDYQQLKRQTAQWSRNVTEEMVFIIVHGFLHLLGFDDKTEAQAKRMALIGEQLIKKLKL